jgi:hypothetical protein
MSTPLRFEDFREWTIGPERREAVRTYLEQHKGIVARVAARGNVDRTVVSKILHGRAVSAPVVAAIEMEEKKHSRIRKVA